MSIAAEYVSLAMLPSINCCFISIQNYETKGILRVEPLKAMLNTYSVWLHF